MLELLDNKPCLSSSAMFNVVVLLALNYELFCLFSYQLGIPLNEIVVFLLGYLTSSIYHKKMRTLLSPI